MQPRVPHSTTAGADPELPGASPRPRVCAWPPQHRPPGRQHMFQPTNQPASRRGGSLTQKSSASPVPASRPPWPPGSLAPVLASPGRRRPGIREPGPFTEPGAGLRAGSRGLSDCLFHLAPCSKAPVFSRLESSLLFSADQISMSGWTPAY